MLAQAEALEQDNRVRCENLASVMLGKHGKQNGDEATHDVRIAVAGKGEHGPAGAIVAHGCRQPDLAGATLHLVCVGAVAFCQRPQCATEFDEIAIAVVPLFEQGKIVDDLVERGTNRRRSGHGLGHDEYIGASLRLGECCGRRGASFESLWLDGCPQ